MQPKNLLLVSLAVAVVGIAALILYVQTLQPKNIDVRSVDRTAIGEYVVLSGEIQSVEWGEASLSVRICDVGCVTVRIPKDIDKVIAEGDIMTVKGYVSEYLGYSYIEVKNRQDISVAGSA